MRILVYLEESERTSVLIIKDVNKLLKNSIR